MKPIIMSTEDVGAVLDGRKTMARIPIKPQPTYWDDGECVYGNDKIVGHELYSPICVDKDGEQYPGEEVYGIYSDNGEYGCKAPYKPGDVLWVRETWKPQDYQFIDGMWNCAIVYKAGGMEGRVYWPDGTDSIYERCGIWRPSIHMPKEAARIFLRVTGVRAERLQDITLKDIEQEGLYCDPKYADPTRTGHYAYEPGMRIHFTKLWDSLNAKRGYGWDTNPYVWVIEFERIEKGEAAK